MPLTEKVRGHNTKEMIKSKCSKFTILGCFMYIYAPNEDYGLKPGLRHSMCMGLSIIWTRNNYWDDVSIDYWLLPEPFPPLSLGPETCEI